MSSLLNFSDRVTCLPVIHGSGDFAIEVRRLMLSEKFDCLAVPLPPSFQAPVEEAIDHLPGISVVVQRESNPFAVTDWTPDADDDDDAEGDPEASYVPIDPCQPVINALRIAKQERMPRAFIDLETSRFVSIPAVLPDAYALKRVTSEQFAAAVLPAIPRPPEGQPTDRVKSMAARLRDLEGKYERILFVCSIMEWPWVREAFTELHPESAADDETEDAIPYAVDPKTLTFALGELPFVTGLYERARYELDDDTNLSIDGVKELLLVSRDRYQADLGARARSVSPKMLQIFMKYVRNLALMNRRLTPDLYSLIVASQQIVGDTFAVHLAEQAREYPFERDLPYDPFRMGIGEGRVLPDGEPLQMKNRLPGHAVSWQSLELKPTPPKEDRQKWEMSWNPFSHCSWPPEDVAIEQFRTRVKDAALAMLGHDLARSEKFQTSLKDGLDIRETLRNWHTGDLYVKVLPPTIGDLDCVVMLFDSPADPRDYPWRVTWHAESHDESTLALFATDYRKEMVGPGIGLARYGGAVFFFPPRPIPDVWGDPRLDFADTLEERLLGAACMHSRMPHVAILSSGPPGPAWRRLGKRFNKKWVHVPLSRFSQETVAQLRMFHVLNGKQVRNYAAEFIRKA